MQSDLEKKILSCVNGESIVKPFPQVFEEVREKPKKTTETKKIFSSEESIYTAVIQQFLKEHPELIKEEK